MKHKGKIYLGVKEVLVRLEIGHTTLYKIIADGAFTQTGDTFMLRGRRMFSEEAINRYIDSQINMS